MSQRCQGAQKSLRRQAAVLSPGSLKPRGEASLETSADTRLVALHQYLKILLKF